MALLLDGGRLGITLDHQQPAQHGAVFPRHLLPHRLALMGAEADRAALNRGGQQHTPFVFGHLYIVELGPALGVDADGGAQIDQAFLESFRAHILPPVDITGMPGLQRLAHAQILRQADVVGNQAVIINVHYAIGHGGAPIRVAGCSRVARRCHSVSGPRSHPRRWGAERSSSARRSAGQKCGSPSSPARQSADWPPCR